ncbi:hypothetical protein [Roseisolibacter agri]|uniref:Uncharacterized protein n=1 Tax=Roseisolibacter agri TaxID=2014610 RepID=A0AA37V131_9BACT|nr:hypothetical protein [Roseisolibacter agri]GLC25540.1 hypothetical protein rosag_20530 [Roseisolibacter agri]
MLANHLQWTTTSPATRAPYADGQCSYELVLPDSIGLAITTSPNTTVRVAAAGDWWPRELVAARDSVLVVRVLGALCSGPDALNVNAQVAPALVVFQHADRYGMVPLEVPQPFHLPLPGRVPVDGGTWQTRGGLFQARPGATAQLASADTTVERVPGVRVQWGNPTVATAPAAVPPQPAGRLARAAQGPHRVGGGDGAPVTVTALARTP